MKVICTTMFSPSNQELANISVPNLKLYCEKHGYGMHLIHISDGDFAYKKHEAFERLFNKTDVDVIFYKDVDSIITNLTIPIENFLDDDCSFYITRDFNELNGGAVIIKNSNHGIEINDLVLSMREYYDNEQNVINSIDFLSEVGGFINVLPHPSINSYDYSLYPECEAYRGRNDLGDWKPTDFLIHFPGLGINDRIELLKEFNEKVIYE